MKDIESEPLDASSEGSSKKTPYERPTVVAVGNVNDILAAGGSVPEPDGAPFTPTRVGT